MNEMTDIEILETVAGGVMIKEMTALTFLGWLSGKINGLIINNRPEIGELRMAIANPPMMPRMAEETKIRYVRKLLALGVSIS